MKYDLACASDCALLPRHAAYCISVRYVPSRRRWYRMPKEEDLCELSHISVPLSHHL